MDFGLSSEQQMLRATVDQFLQKNCSMAQIREVANAGLNTRDALTTGFHGLGLSGIMVPEAFDGLGLSLLDAAVVSEALGTAVAPIPFAARAVLAPIAFGLAGSPEQKNHWLPRVARGEARFSVAITELVNRRDGAGIHCFNGRLQGSALFALDSEGANAYIVADQEGRLHIVADDAAGFEKVNLKTIDVTRSVSELRFDSVVAEPFGADDGSAGRWLIAAGRVLLAADSVGAADAMIAKAVAYAGERKQFDRVIGSFQAVKHMCAEMAARQEPCRSLVWYAAHSFDTIPAEAQLMACFAKSHVGEVGRFVARTATEVHGGMGFTDLLGLHYWFKRIGFDRQILGGPEIVRSEAGAMQGWNA